MPKYQCPYCGEKSVSFLRKLIISPIISHDCSNCHKPICVPIKSNLLVIPTFLILLFGSNFFSGDVVLILFLVSLCTTSWLHGKFVPLIKAKL